MSPKNKIKEPTHTLSEAVVRKDINTDGFRADLPMIDSKKQHYSYLTAAHTKFSKRAHRDKRVDSSEPIGRGTSSNVEEK